MEDRLRAALDVRLEDLHEGVDMSGEAVGRRVRELCEMSALCLELVTLDPRDRQ
ncbi:MAG TPA: hypothetical protein VIV11_39495 [Kofleriaceae bacterium]